MDLFYIEKSRIFIFSVKMCVHFYLYINSVQIKFSLVNIYNKFLVFEKVDYVNSKKKKHNLNLLLKIKTNITSKQIHR